jgi:hypothetical protein
MVYECPTLKPETATMLNPLALATTMTVLLAGAALAGPCEQDLKRIDRALQSDSVPAAQKVQVRDMRSQAQKLCAAGNTTEAADVIAEAKALLAIE